jgi:2-keto-4-pentenoate hydratase
VAATFVEMSAPITFITAAIVSATRGVSARVEIEVAIALAESWNPLVKSNPSATTTMTTTRAVEFTGSRRLHCDRLDCVRDVLERVGGVLETVGNLA